MAIVRACGIAALGVYLASYFIVGAGSPFELISNLQNWFSVPIGDALGRIIVFHDLQAVFILRRLAIPHPRFCRVGWVTY